MVANIVLNTKHRFSAKHTGTYYFRTGFLTQLLALESNQWGQVINNVHSDLLGKDMLIFPVKLMKDVWSLFAVVALPYFVNTGVPVPMLYYFNPNGTCGIEEDIIDKGNRIRVLLNIICVRLRNYLRMYESHIRYPNWRLLEIWVFSDF